MYINIMYKLLVGLDRSNVYKSDWLKHIKKILANCELENVWYDTDVVMRMSSVMILPMSISLDVSYDIADEYH